MREGGEVDDGEMRSVDLVGSRPDVSILESMGTSLDVPGAAASSGFAIRSPPKDCDRLKSFCIVGNHQLWCLSRGTSC